MKKKTIDLSRLLLVCVFAFMMGILLFPQTASAADEPNIYWAVDSAGNLVISDQEVQGTTQDSFPADTVFDENSTPWGSGIETVKIEGAPAPQHTDYWFSGCENLKTVDLGDLDLSKCKSMIKMFQNCPWLSMVNLCNMDISACTNFSSMLDGCLRLEVLIVGPSWRDLPSDNNMRAAFPTSMNRWDIEPSQNFNQGTPVPEYKKSDAGINLYLNGWIDSLTKDAKALVKVLKKINALPGITDPDALKDAVETALCEYNHLSARAKDMAPAEAIAILDDARRAAGIDQLPRQIKIKWSSIDGEDLMPPITFDLPPSGIRLNDLLSQYYNDEICSHFAKEGYAPRISSYYSGGKIVGYNPMSGYSDRVTFEIYDDTNWPDPYKNITEFTILYFYSTKSAGDIKMTVDPLRCGTKGSAISQTWLKIDPEDVAKLHEHFRDPSGAWTIGADDTVKGGQDYCFSISKGSYQEGFGYNYSVMRPLLNGKEPDDITSNEYIWKVTAEHVWDAGKVTKEATIEEEGIMTYTCTKCDEIKTEAIPKLDPENVAARENLEKAIEDASKITKDNYTDESFKALQDAIAEAKILAADPDATTEQLNAAADKIKQAKDNLKEKNTESAPGSDPDQKGVDGTPVGPGASAAAAERAITNMVSDSDPQGTVFGKLALKSPKQTKTSIDLSWNMVPGASSYVIYGNRCGKGIKPVKLAVVNGNKQTITMVSNQKVKKGTYYKFIMVALDKNNTVVSTSRVIHVATKGGKVGNHKKVTVSKSVIKKAKKLKKGKTLKLKAKAVPQSKKLKVRKHRAVAYESSNINIVTVSKKGVVKAKNRGTCYIYAYAQNGVFKKLKVTVK